LIYMEENTMFIAWNQENIRYNFNFVLTLKKMPKAKVPFSVKHSSIDSSLSILHKCLF
jgi:hypothetical protein